jgi:rod shape determining protein RodA
MSERLGKSPLKALFAEWPLFVLPTALCLLGILTMHPFNNASSLAPKQLIWLSISLMVYGILSVLDMRFIRRTSVIMTGYAFLVGILALLLVATHAVMGAKSWFTFGGFSLQPADPGKILFIALIAKYFSRRHMEIGDFKHIVVSGIYASVPILLILLEPDLGTAVIFIMIWFGTILVSGISKKHLLIVGVSGLTLMTFLWFFGLHDYQRARIVTFVNPAADIHGKGYNAYQATVAAGSGQVFGKGIGYGTQSKLKFLPEYETDFIFAAFAEEWGFVGVVLVLILYGLILARLVAIAQRSATNFDSFFTIGVLIMLTSHIFIHAGINLGLLPVTGTTIPFMSYGGSHLLMEFAALGIVTSLAREGRSAPRQALTQEFLA